MTRHYGRWESHFHKSWGQAMAVVNERYQGGCLATNTKRSSRIRVDGCHIFPRSTYPALRFCDLNVVPLVHHKHSWKDDTLDWIKYSTQQRPVAAKPDWLGRSVRDEYREVLEWQLRELSDLSIWLNLVHLPLIDES